MERGLLRQLSDRFSAPLPRKTSFLEELSGDVRALTRRLVQEGLSPDEAHRRALEALVPDDETVRRLEVLHAPWYLRITGRWDSDQLRRAERLGMAATFFVILTIQTVAILQAEFLRYVSPFLWPVLAAGSAVVLAAAKKGFELWVKGDHGTPRSGLRQLLVLSTFPFAIAVAGIWVDVIEVSGAIQLNPELAQGLVVRTLIQDCAMLAIAILFALFGGLCWLLLTHWVAVQEDAHQRALDTTTFPEV
jgi:hypothetical protein